MNPLQRVAKNSAALTLSILMERGISFLLPWYIARELGQSAMGEYNLVLSFIFIFTPIAVWGLDQFLPREVVRDADRIDLTFLHASLLSGVTSLLTTVVMIVVVHLLDYSPPLRNLIYLGGVSLLLLRSESMICEAIIKGLEKMEWVPIVHFPVTIVRIALSIWLLANGYGVPSVFVVLAGYQLAVWLVYLWLVWRIVPGFRLRVDGPLARKLLIQSMPFMAISVLGVAFKQLDRVFLSKLWDTDMVGIYSTGALVVQMMYMLAPAVMEPLFPGLSRLYVAARQSFADIVSLLLKLTFVGALLVTLLLYTLAEDGVLLAFGTEYELSITVFRILVWGIVPSYTGRLLYRAILASNNERVMPRVVFVNDIVSIALNVLLIPRYGVAGASIAAVGTELAGVIQNAVFVHRWVSPLHLYETLVRPGLCMIPSLLVYWVVGKLNIYLAFAAATFVLIGSLFLSHTLSPRDWTDLVRRHW